jgi:hypothetical protein
MKNIFYLITARLSIVLHMAGGSGGGPKKKTNKQAVKPKAERLGKTIATSNLLQS